MDYEGFRTLQSSFFIAAVLSATLCGAYFALGGVTIHRLYGVPGLPRRTFWTLFSIVVTGALLFLGKVTSISALLHAVLIPPVDGIPGWPIRVIFIVTALAFGIGDSLFIYRCWVIWARSRWVSLAVVILLAELIISFSLVVSVDRGSGASGGVVGLWDTTSNAKALAKTAIALTVSLNTILAVAAITQLLLARRALRSAAFPSGGAHYVQISRLLALSSVLYATVWLPMLFSREVTHAMPYYVALFAIVVGMPLLVMLYAGGYRTETEDVVRALPHVQTVSLCSVLPVSQ